MGRFRRFIPLHVVYMRYFKNKFGRFISPEAIIHGGKSKSSSKKR